MTDKKYIQQEINWLRAVHVRENTQSNEDHLNANRYHFTGQCSVILSLLQQGAVLTTASALIQWHIGDLRRRIKDLKDAGVKIDEDWVLDDKGKKTRYKKWFIKKEPNE